MYGHDEPVNANRVAWARTALQQWADAHYHHPGNPDREADDEHGAAQALTDLITDALHLIDEIGYQYTNGTARR